MGDRKPETDQSSKDPSWKTKDRGNRRKETDTRKRKSQMKKDLVMKGKSYR